LSHPKHGHSNLSAKAAYIPFVAVPLICAAIIILRPTRSPALDFVDKHLERAAVRSIVREGLGSEVLLASQPQQARASIDSIANFISERAGVELPDSAKARLSVMEYDVLNGERRRIMPEELSGILVDTALERVRATTDAEIMQAADTLRGFNAPDLPEQVQATRNRVRIRANGESISVGQAVTWAREIRDRSHIPLLLGPMIGVAREIADGVVKDRVDLFSESVPEQWGDVKTRGLTPAQAVLVIYSAASDDYLWHSNWDLQRQMKSTEQTMETELGHYPSSGGRKPYGQNGYLYSTPLEMIFDEHTTNRFLDRVEQRSRR
jgi:hypothetical protein